MSMNRLTALVLLVLFLALPLSAYAFDEELLRWATASYCGQHPAQIRITTQHERSSGEGRSVYWEAIDGNSQIWRCFWFQSRSSYGNNFHCTRAR